MSFTCITCRVAFADAEVQRSHYKADWHRYNLKRKVAEMPPVTAENFQQRVLAQRAQVAECEKDQSGHCTICNKHFSSKNAYENHLKSKKHKEAEVKEERKRQTEVEKRNEKNAEKGLEVMSENEKVLLKNAKNQAMKEAMDTESRASAPTAGTSGASSGQGASSSKTKPVEEAMDTDDEDAESVESWEGEALGLEECLFCSFISKSLEKNLAHMTKAHSFFIPDVEFLTDVEGLLTYLGQKVGEGYICLWCNEKGKSFTTAKSAQQHMVDKGHCKMLFEGDAVFEYSDFFDYRKSYPDYREGEEGEGDEDDEEEMSEEAVEEASYQLVLPSGGSVGHRSLQRYYRQKLRPDRPHNLTPLAKVMSQYRALGWTGSTGAIAKTRAKDMAYVQRVKQRHNMRLGCKAHKLVQHYRDQIFSFG